MWPYLKGAVSGQKTIHGCWTGGLRTTLLNAEPFVPSELLQGFPLWAPLHRHPDTFTLQMRLFCLQVAKAKTDLKKKGEKMPMFYTGALTKWAGVNFLTCSSIGDHFVDFFKCFLKSSLGRGGWGWFLTGPSCLRCSVLTTS